MSTKPGYQWEWPSSLAGGFLPVPPTTSGASLDMRLLSGRSYSSSHCLSHGPQSAGLEPSAPTVQQHSQSPSLSSLLGLSGIAVLGARAYLLEAEETCWVIWKALTCQVHWGHILNRKLHQKVQFLEPQCLKHDYYAIFKGGGFQW